MEQAAAEEQAEEQSVYHVVSWAPDGHRTYLQRVHDQVIGAVAIRCPRDDVIDQLALPPALPLLPVP